MVRFLKNIGHFFIALTAVLWHGYPAKRLTVIGVTGTDGKTTTSTLIYHLLKTAGKKMALISTVAAYIGDEQIDVGLHVTSPEPWALQKLIKRIITEGYTHLVLEATSHGLDQHRLLGTNVKIGVVTNITHEHLDYHRTYTNYLRAKAKLLRHAQHAIINADDQSFEPLKNHLNRLVITYTHKGAPAYVKDRFPETYNQANAQAAIAVARLFEIDEAIIEKSVTSFEGVVGRMQSMKNQRGLKIIVDFAHTPNALESTLKALKKQTKGKLIAFFGAAGLRDRDKRPMMGEIAARLADEVVLTAEDPRTENIHTIISQIKAGATTNHGHLHSIPDRQAAIDFAIHTLAKKGDTIGIFGKGHEQSLNLDGKTEMSWSDEQAVVKSLKGESK